MKNFRTTFNIIENDEVNNFAHGEYYDLEKQPSLTDPSQAMEIKDILHTFSRGGAVRILRSQNFGEEVPREFQAITQRMHQMDRVEKAQAIKDNQSLIDTTKKEIEKNQALKAQKKQKEQQNPEGGD